MVRIQVLAQSLCMLLWLAFSANSQPPPPPFNGPRADDSHRSDSKEREAFFEVMREVLPHKELFDLLDHEDIRREVKLSDADAEAIEDNVRNTFEALRKLRDADSGQPLTLEQLKQKVRQTIAPFNQLSYEILEKNSDFNRLLGLYVQARGYRALLNDKVAKKIGLEGEALESFRKLRSESWQELMEETNDAIKRHIRNAPPGTQPPRDTISDLFKHAEKKLEEKSSRELSEQQKADFEKLKGAKFNLPEHPFYYPGRGRGGPRGPKEKGSDRKDPEKPPHDRKAECDKCSGKDCCPSLRIGYSSRSRQEFRFF